MTKTYSWARATYSRAGCRCTWFRWCPANREILGISSSELFAERSGPRGIKKNIAREEFIAREAPKGLPDLWTESSTLVGLSLLQGTNNRSLHGGQPAKAAQFGTCPVIISTGNLGRYVGLDFELGENGERVGVEDDAVLPLQRSFTHPPYV
jgi:hypothetical protein